MTDQDETEINAEERNSFLYIEGTNVPKGTGYVTIHHAVKNIKKDAFKYCHRITSIEIPQSVTCIGSSSFEYCVSLTNITLPLSIATIGKCAFANCNSLTTLTIPNSVTSIEDDTFYGCSSLISIFIPNSITRIGDRAFFNCTSLLSIALPSTLKDIGRRVFDNCSALEKLQSKLSPSIEARLRRRFVNLPMHEEIYCSNNDGIEITKLPACQENNDGIEIKSKSIIDLVEDNPMVLSSTDCLGMTPLHLLCCNPKASLQMVKLFKNAYPDAVSMKTLNDMSPLMLYLASNNFSFRWGDNNETDHSSAEGSCTPLGTLLRQKVQCDNLDIIFALAFDNNTMLVSELEKQDTSTKGFYPYMYAALLPKCGLDMVYMLALKRPELLNPLS
jgi:hypothetical protein